MEKTVRLPGAAMVLAAGLGARMRPLTDGTPKPLIRLNGKALIDYGLDHLLAPAVEKVVVNVHHHAGQVVAHLRARGRPHILVSDETGELLDTGGGIRKALPLIGKMPFYLINSDTAWRDWRQSALHRLASAYDDATMDALLLLIEPERAVGYDGPGDFVRDGKGRLRRREEGDKNAAAYMGVAILHPRLFRGAPRGRFSLNLLFDRAISQGRLFGIIHEGDWMHVGTPQALKDAEEFLARRPS